MKKLKVIIEREVRNGNAPVYATSCPLCRARTMTNYKKSFVDIAITSHLTGYHRVEWDRIKLKTKDV